ncbi:MAG: hypothetical protein IJ071_06570 [Ruminococcus sp.]|nr:hypothetical protein [Ruminococcus sp.]
MLSTPEYAFRKRKKVATVFRGKKTVWADREEAKNYILEEMMTAEGEDYDRYEAIYLQLIHGMSNCIDD